MRKLRARADATVCRQGDVVLQLYCKYAQFNPIESHKYDFKSDGCAFESRQGRHRFKGTTPAAGWGGFYLRTGLMLACIKNPTIMVCAGMNEGGSGGISRTAMMGKQEGGRYG
jgi:hypothetical protein